jgi:outer membrane murein-binding lipoprotein Lpp
MLAHLMRARLRLGMVLSVALAGAALVVAGCGSDSKPEYCSNVSDLQSSVEDLGAIQLNSSTLSTLQTDLQTVQTNADAVVSSAKSDFPSQTSALQSSVSSLSKTIKKLPASPTPQQLLPLTPEISSVVTAAKNFESATSSACD